MESLFQSYPEDARRIGEEYLSSLTDLNCNSKPLINMLTMLAEENINYAQVIVRVVEYHISQVPPEFKLPILYLIDSIIKNVKSSYVQLFGQCIVNIFLHAFESVQHSPSQVLEKVRERMYLLRQTWNEVFPASKMYALDVKVKRLDNNWPITAKPSQATKIHVNPAIHVNPDFLKTGMVSMPVNNTLQSDMEEILQAKTRELLELKKRKLELELEQTKLHLKEQERQLSQATDAISVAPMTVAAPTTSLRPPGMETILAPTGAAVAPMYPSGMRQMRPMAPAVAGGMPPVIGQQPPFANKPKVHPVNPAMLSSVRQRDPRLARQQQSQPSSQMAAPMRTADPRLEGHKTSSSSSSSTHKSSRSRSKSPMRNSGSSRSSKSVSSSNHHHTSSSGNSSRKRSESKSSTASTSSSGSDGRHKSSNSGGSPVKRSSSSRDKPSNKEQNERYAHNGGSPVPSKRKSSSPASSPAKSKRNATHKSSSSSSSSTSRRDGASSKPSSSSNQRSRSRSPIYKDVDMRSVTRSKSPEVASGQGAPSTATAAKIQTAAAAATTTPDTALNAIDLEKPHLSTASLLAATAIAPSLTADVANVKQPSPAPSSSLQQSINKLMNPAQTQVGGEKRSAGQLPLDHDDVEEDEHLQQPQQKRSKSAKLDALFGSEDVDLRRVLPGKPVAIGASSVIVVEDDSMDNCDSDKSAKASHRKPSLDELRAKLATTARNNQKLSKGEKLKDHPVTQRLKQLAELKPNDDSQEAHDETMRTILSQAQEMFENHGMNEDQYKDLVTKVVAMNESSKLKDNRRRDPADDEDSDRNAARDAVLRKRIPKLKGNENHASSSPRSDGDPRGYEDQHLVNNEKAQAQSKLSKSKRDGKRRKPSKWGDQVDPAAAQRAAWQLAQNNNNNNNNNNKRMPVANVAAGGAFRSTPWQHPPMVIAQAAVPPPPQPPTMMGMPNVAPAAMTKAINSLDNPMADMVRSITIDGGSKEIRFYNQVAVIFMDGDEPHEIGFQHGQRAIYIDHNEPLALSFNDDYKPFQLEGQLHRIRFGHPSRELYIDDHWYEIYFGGPPVSLPIGNKLHVLKAEGPPPNVDIGRVRRDLVVGKINMIVDAHTIVPLFLDGRQQTFLLGAEQHSLQFVDSFLYALLDGQLQKLEYGGLPKSMKLNGGRNCFIRFGTLPKGVQAGKAHVQDMVYIKTDAPAEPPQPPPLPVPVTAPIQGIVPLEQPTASSLAGAPAGGGNAAVSLPAAAAALSNLNIDELFQKLVSSGIIGAPSTVPAPVTSNVSVPGLEVTSNSSKDAAPAVAVPIPAATPSEPIKRIDLNKPDTIKTRQTAVIATLYLGMQCSSCGVRFPPEQTIKYSQHLDWHFRQNRRERDSTRKATSKRWFYDLTDWRQYEEIEDVEEREKNFLEAQGQQLGPDAADEVSQQRSMDSPMPSCAAGTDDVDRCCDMCHEKFEQFYNEELEEWHLRSAIRVEDKIYHPLCYEDYKSSLNPPAPVVSEPSANGDVDMLSASDDNAMDTLIKLEDDINDAKNPSETLMDDDDDDVIVLPNEEPSVTEIVDDDDDEEYVPVSVARTEADVDSEKEKEPASALNTEEGHEQGLQKEKEYDQHQKAENANESDVDVEIQEPNIPFTDLDTYVEKEPLPLLNVKIKEEPKDDDEDEDDDFEDVGTVVTLLPLPEDEISINSSETQTQTIDSSASPATIERPASVASLSMPAHEDELELEPVGPVPGTSSEADFNGENPQETHNLSAAGPAPALPLASIVNKIKINITKNTSSNSHNSASTTTTTTTTTAAAAATDSQVSAISVIGGSGNTDGQHQLQQQQQQNNSIETISTIPVLCGGNMFVPKIATSSSTNAPPANISSISVIGSNYGSSSSSNNSTSGSNNNSNTSAASRSNTATVSSMGAPALSTTSSSGNATAPTAQRSTTPPPAAAVEADPEPIIEQKPALRNVTLKKTKKVQNGVETSGLCSIM
ncbi:uncharacterized protein LOC133840419 isoform X3 [Drosophila sulfurigaster albostrigata]|uniref:uncharacterized protein LOC133840419 isoform X3 n=1 Tax=Drosophila sulfurigaster albostrigata TaxID=89887 RepID=UPI002D21C797|nr:uncharacterized protein LOC133840419 isoform X3 [Drosophila sulfurigaster albostrigata]